MAGRALIMAGGQGTRMSASGVALPKPLVPVLAVPVLERNVYALIRYGIDQIAVAIPDNLPSLEHFASGRLRRLAVAAGVRLEVFVETLPLGNIGCAGRWRDGEQALLVVYADNLTTLDLADVVAAHEASGADMTLATHLHPFRMPFGEVQVEDGRVRAYVEKPVYSFPVASAVSVLGPRALAALPDDRPTGLSGLAQGLIDDGCVVREYRHAATWIDVNDAIGVRDAEALVARHQPAFDLWARPPATSAAVGLAVADGAVLLIGGHARWTLPAVQPAGTPDFVFDDLDGTETRTCRVHVHRIPPAAAAGFAHAAWRKLADVAADPDVTGVARRVLAIAARPPSEAA